MGRLLHPKATDWQKDIIPRFNLQTRRSILIKCPSDPSGSDGSSVDPAEAAAGAKEREKGWNAGTPRRANADGAWPLPATALGTPSPSLLVLPKPLPHEVARGAPGAHDRSGQTVRQRHDGREAGCGGRHQGRLPAKLPKLLLTGSS